MSLYFGAHSLMLNKKYCQKCWTIVADSYNANMKFYNDEMVIGWSENDEKDWEKGIVYCPVDYRNEGEKPYTKIIEKPPDKCPFILENILDKEK